MRTVDRRLAILVLVALCAAPSAAQETVTRFDLTVAGDVQIVTDVVVAGRGTSDYTHRLAPGSTPSSARAVDRASNKALSVQSHRPNLLVNLGRILNEKAEQRLRIEEQVARDEVVRQQQGSLVFDYDVAPGRAVVVWPRGYTVAISSVPVQLRTKGERVEAGVINRGPTALHVRLEARRISEGGDVWPGGAFRAEDDRNIVYWLGDPAQHRIDLALEMVITRPGQAHVYSVLRKGDNIVNPVTLDVDRGVELPTRIVTGREASTIGDGGAPFDPDASVLVADLGYAVPAGGSARVRLYQTATDQEGYQLLANDEMRWDRFLGRLHTRAVLPKGWALSSVDQPTSISRDDEGRVVLDFVQSGANSPSLVLTARKGGSEEAVVGTRGVERKHTHRP